MPTSWTSWAECLKACKRSWAKEAACCREARDSASASAAPWFVRMPAWCCSTSRSAAWTVSSAAACCGEHAQVWQKSTLLCVTHDVGATRDFERVLVVESGRIVEDGCPRELAAQPESRYRALLDAEGAVRSGLWASTCWRRLRLEEGRLTETTPEHGSPAGTPAVGGRLASLNGNGRH